MSWLDRLHELIQASEPNSDGIRLIERDWFFSVRSPGNAQLSYAEACEAILDTRFDWRAEYVRDEPQSMERALLNMLLAKIRFTHYLDYDESLADALLQRYSPEGICDILSSAECLAADASMLGSSMEERHVLLERLTCIVTDTPAILDAWVTLTLRALRDRECLFGNNRDFFKGLSQLFPVTDTYRQLPAFTDNKLRSTRTLLSVMAMGSCFIPQEFKTSIERYVKATLYELTDAKLTGNFDIRGNTLTRAFVHGLYLVKDHAEPFIRLHLKQAPIQNNDTYVCAALLATVPYLKNHPYSIKQLMQVKDAVNGDALELFSQYYLFGWRPDLIETLFATPKLRSLTTALRSIDQGLPIFERVMRSCYLSKSEADQARNLLQRIPPKAQQAVVKCLHHFFRVRVDKTSIETMGSLLTLMAVLDEDKPRLRSVLLPYLQKVFKKGQKTDATSRWAVDRLNDGLALLYHSQVLTLEDIGPCIQDDQHLRCFARLMEIEPQALLNYTKNRIHAECLESELGL